MQRSLHWNIKTSHIITDLNHKNNISITISDALLLYDVTSANQDVTRRKKCPKEKGIMTLQTDLTPITNSQHKLQGLKVKFEFKNTQVNK